MEDISVLEFDITQPKFQNIVNDENTMINIINLKKGEELPKHNANSNVYLIVLNGKGRLVSAQDTFDLEKGKLFKVKKGTEMQISNFESGGIFTFCVVKIPNPNK